MFCVAEWFSLLSDVGGETQEDAAKWVYERRRNRWISSIRKLSSKQSMAYWITARSIFCLLIQNSMCPCSLRRGLLLRAPGVPAGWPARLALRGRGGRPLQPRAPGWDSGQADTSIIKFVTFQVETVFVTGEMWYSTPRIPATSSLSLWRSFGYVTM